MKPNLRALVVGLALLAPVPSSLAQVTPGGRPTVSNYNLEVYKPGYQWNIEYYPRTPAADAGPFISVGSNEILKVKWTHEIRFTALRPDDASETPLATLTPRWATPYGSELLGSVTADFNHDGRIEMLLTASASLEMITYDGNAAVSTYFQDFPRYLWIDSSPVAADFDRDGHMDIVFHKSQRDTRVGAEAQLVIFRGNGANDFAEEIDHATGGANPGDRQFAIRVVTGDFDRDGWPDVAVLFDQRDAATQIVSRPIKVFLNNGAGSFLAPYTLLDDNNLSQIAVGDLDGDGFTDLVATTSVATTNSGWLHVFKQNEHGQLALAGSLATDAESEAVDVADLDGDGRLDVVSGSWATYRVASYIQQRNGALAPATFSDRINSPGDLRVLRFDANSFTVTDLTADGCNDLFITQGEWRLRGQGCARTLYTPGDIDDDGKTDLLWRHAAQQDLALWKMEGPARVQGFGYAVDSAWKVLATGDFNGDRWMDLLWSDGQNMQLWEGDGLSQFAGSLMPAFPQGWRLTATGDFDGDGNDDLFWRNAADTDAALWRLDGAQVIEQRGYATSPAWRIEGSGDFNADGRTDLVWTNGAQMQLWQAQPGLAFAGVALPGFPSGWQLAGVSDVSGDGNADLLWFQPQIGELAIWEYRGTGDVQGRGYAVGPNWRILQTGDFNADGFSDVVWTNGRQMQMWQSQGDGFLGLPMDDYPAGWMPVEHSKAIEY